MLFCTGFTVLAWMGLRRAFGANRFIAMPYIIVSVLFPLIYYLTHPEDYHRRLIDPQYIVLAACVVASWIAERRESQYKDLGGPAMRT